MTDPTNDRLWAIFFQSLIPVWGLVGLLVVIAYGRASNQNWRLAGGTWPHAPVEWMRVAWFVLRGCVRDLWCLVRMRPLQPELPAPLPYKPGHLLQFLIVLSFSLATLSGAVSWSADRSEWPNLLRSMSALGIGMSIVAGWGYLFLAWSAHPRRWRWFVVLTFLYVPIAFLLRA